MLLKRCSYLFSALCLALFSGCSATEHLQLTTVEPAPVVLEHSIKRIGILDTSESADQGEFASRLEQKISYEDYRLVEEGKQAAIEALFNELDRDRRFDTIILITETPGSLKGLDGVPSSDNWVKIAQLCQEQDVDAIFCLTNFESATTIETRKAAVENLDMLRVKNKVRGHEITLETFIENGWRIYHPKSRKVVDEFVYSDQIVATAKGITPISALESMENREREILQKSMEKGSTYGSRLKPSTREIARPYYSAGTDNFKAAHEAIENEDWDQALSLWEKEVNNVKPKIKARACYNIAVLKESQKELDKALAWARRALEAHQDETTQEYVTILEKRKSEAKTVALQLAALASETP